jgi:opacity protein-like surface antigen
MMEQQRQLYAKLQQTLAPHSEWMVKLAQKMPTVDPAVLENLQKSKAAIEAAMAEHVKNIQAYEETLKPQIQKMQDAARGAMGSQLEAIKAASGPLLDWMKQSGQVLGTQMKAFGDAMESAAKAWAASAGKGEPEKKGLKDTIGGARAAVLVPRFRYCGLYPGLTNSMLDDNSTTGNFPAGVLFPYRLTVDEELRWFGTMRGRIGLSFDRFLIFGTGGLAYGGTEASASIANLGGGTTVFNGNNGALTCVGGACLAGSETKTSFGWAAGFGFEWALWNNTRLKAEYIHLDLGDQTIVMTAQPPSFGVGSITAKFDNSFDIVRGGLNVGF